MRTVLITFALLLPILPSPAFAQSDWDTVRALENDTRIRIHQSGSAGWKFADGRVIDATEDAITIRKGDASFDIPRAQIERIQLRRGDPVIEGALFGALYAIVAHGFWAGAERGNLAGGITTTAAVGAFIDWRIERKPTIYRAPRPSARLIAITF